jgi:AraC-like DNA-binding protein
MTPTMHASTPASRRSVAVRETGITPRRRATRSRRQRASHEHPALGHYVDRHGHAREVIAQQGAAGSTLIVDRDCAGHGDPRLVAHLAADEPAENAALVCRSYLHDLTAGGARPRKLTPEDAHVAPFADQRETDAGQPQEIHVQPVDRFGRAYSLELVPGGMSIPELRWCRGERDTSRAGEPVSLRDAIAALECYEPVRERTLKALAQDAGAVSTTLLRVELARVQQSPIVLNRRLREVVLATVARYELSMSEIALRCGRIKRDRKGNESGETSWLARRIGLLPEGGHSLPTPWIHSDVLALIARRGLGIGPHEVEL